MIGGWLGCGHNKDRPGLGESLDIKILHQLLRVMEREAGERERGERDAVVARGSQGIVG